MKRVLGQSRFVFGCHRSKLTQTKEREGVRDNQKSPKQQKYIKIYWIENTYAWKCMNMWHAKVIASWAQPNPILPAHKFATRKTQSKNAWNIVIMQMKCNAWRFKVKNTKNIPKFLQKPLWIWKTPNFSSNPKGYVIKDELHEKEGLGPLPSEEKLDLVWKILEEEARSEWDRYWEVKSQERSREIKRNKSEIARTLYIQA